MGIGDEPDRLSVAKVLATAEDAYHDGDRCLRVHLPVMDDVTYHGPASCVPVWMLAMANPSDISVIDR